MDAPFQPHSGTSRDAATAIRPKAETLRAMVLTAIENIGARGLTDEELQHDLDLEGSTQRPRRVEFLRAGLIRDSGRTRKTASGRAATVWVAA